MKFHEWEQKYQEILDEFDYNKEKDFEAAKLLDSILKTSFPLKRLEKKIRTKTVFVIGAGPSLTSSIAPIRKFKNITKIVADGAARALVENKIRPDIVVTDLDGNLEYLKKASNMNAIMVVHSHGDNIRVLPIASLFRNCIGTTEGKPFGKIKNFGGFTDGDRCVFLAKHFGARRIILLGMDFGTRVGRYSKEEIYDKQTKIKKLKKGRSLLEWLASNDDSGLYTTSKPIKGFQKIRFREFQGLVRPQASPKIRS
jgi:2-amino-4-hydroxy-6-hydroxymethyldihydropteridine diphosphokinase